MSAVDGVVGNRNGRISEELFVSAWSNPRYYPPWLAYVRRATKHEDYHEKTDAVMYLRDGSTLRIQVKQTRIRLYEAERLMTRPKGVVPLIVPHSYSPAMIRLYTLLAIQLFGIQRQLLLRGEVVMARLFYPWRTVRRRSLWRAPIPNPFR
ncbi:MAG: hypothetical protein V4674_02635 [Patescibacteria group bacterium]